VLGGGAVVLTALPSDLLIVAGHRIERTGRRTAARSAVGGMLRA
jgi:hypothetical protein